MTRASIKPALLHLHHQDVHASINQCSLRHYHQQHLLPTFKVQRDLQGGY
jgi:hypothetical protein